VDYIGLSHNAHFVNTLLKTHATATGKSYSDSDLAHTGPRHSH